MKKLEEMVVSLCAPCLAGIKTGNIFSIRYGNHEELFTEMKCLNKMLVSKGLSLIPLKCTKEYSLIYLYRPALLKNDLSDSQAYSILQESGYQCGSCSRCIGKLIERLKDTDSFPHEIGLFLSYPPEDVRGFISNHAENYKLSGCWKVYGDEIKARSLFSKYKCCSELYRNLYKNGVSIESLAIAC